MNHSEAFLKAWEIACRAPDAHPFCVAGEVLGLPGHFDSLFIVALLHDSLEDGYASEEELREAFPQEVLSSVQDLTRPAGEAYWDYIRRISLFGSAVAQQVKIADARVNLERCVASENWSLARRYERVLDILEE